MEKKLVERVSGLCLFQLFQAATIVELQLFDLDLLGLQFYRLSFARQPMRGNAGNFFGRKRRRILRDFADELCRSIYDLLQ